jgi:hypothetical protein
MLDRSIPTREALVHSIPISEVKDMKSDVLQAQFKQFSRMKNCIDFEFPFATYPPLGLNFFLKFISNSVFPFITYPFLLIDFFEV